MNPIPETLGRQTADAINALLAGSDRFRDWGAPEIQALLPVIAKLQKADARQAFILYGSLAAICGDIDKALEYYRKALQLPDQSETKHEFWVSLGNLGLYSKATEIGSWLLEPKRGFFPRVWQQAVSTGLVREAWKHLSEAEKLFPDLAKVDFSTLERAVQVMEKRQISDEDIVSVLNLMGEVQRAHRIMYSGALISNLRVMNPPEDPPYLYFAIPLDASVTEIQTMNRELTNLLIERLAKGAFPQGVVAAFAKAAPAELRAAA